jgi:hypothetical protein
LSWSLLHGTATPSRCMAFRNFPLRLRFAGIRPLRHPNKPMHRKSRAPVFAPSMCGWDLCTLAGYGAVTSGEKFDMCNWGCGFDSKGNILMPRTIEATEQRPRALHRVNAESRENPRLHQRSPRSWLAISSSLTCHDPISHFASSFIGLLWRTYLSNSPAIPYPLVHPRF